MGSGLESRCVGRVYGVDGAVHGKLCINARCHSRFCNIAFCKHLSCVHFLKFGALLFRPHSVLILVLVWWLPESWNRRYYGAFELIH